jgi:tetratricopeptide (TPR) repeat protein
MKLRFLTAACAAVILTACQTAGTANYISDEPSSEAKLFGEYLAGSYAYYLEDSDARSEYYSRAFARAENDIPLGRRAMSSAITAGNMDLARTLAIEINQKDNKETMALTLLGEKAFKQGRHKRAQELLNPATGDLTMAIAMGLMKGWSYVATDEMDKARKTFRNLGGGSYFQNVADLQIAKAEALRGNVDAAKAAFKIAEENGQSAIETRLAKARFLHSIGENDLALKELEAFSKQNGGFESGPVAAYIAALKKGEKIEGLLTPTQEASRALTEPAFGFFAANRARDAAEVFLRLALSLDPRHDKAVLWLGDLLDNTERSDEAMRLYKDVPETSHYIVSAKLAEANVHFANEEDAKAVKVLEDVNSKHPSFITREALGRARLIRENYAEALPIYEALVNSMTEEELKANTQPLYFRGICYEREKQWDKAEADFKRVLEIEPDNADALNYLGYTWVDRGENLTEAFEMIRKAVELEPNSGAITDSLGWAHYKLGQYEEAKKKLEDAVVLSPSSATIIDHLGDVYWKLGRFREAGYQWERALEFDPTDEERANIKLKLKGQFDAVQKNVKAAP